MEKTHIRIDFHHRINNFYFNEYFKIKSDVDVTFKEIREGVSKRAGFDVYIAPVSYSIPNGAKENAAFVTTFLVDFDIFDGK